MVAEVLNALDEGADLDQVDAASRRASELGEECTSSLLLSLSRRSECLPSATFAATSAVLHGSVSAQGVHDSLLPDNPCAQTVVAAVQFGESVHPDVVAEVLGWTLRQDGFRRSAALVVLASLARKADAPEARATVDRLITSELSRASTDPAAKLQLIEAAGNGACAPCLKRLRSARYADDQTRRAVVAAHRFLNDDEGTGLLIAALERDRSPTVRAEAAWAIKWTTSGEERRVEALLRASLRDPVKRVRLVAAASLAELSGSTELARSALLHLTAPEIEPDVRDLALGVFVAPVRAEQRRGGVAQELEALVTQVLPPESGDE